jgi:glycosyltransferase involved in cell wall biosynthesis
MSAQLLLLTKTYPYANGEEFIESEIDYLAQAFDEVVVLAVAAGEGAEQTRRLPANARAFAAALPSGNTLKVACGSCADIAVDLLRPLLHDYDKAALRYSPRRWVYFRYYAAKVKAIRDAIADLREQGVLQAPTLIYSYWFHDTAVAALLARELFTPAPVPVVTRAHGYDLYEYASSTGYLPLRSWSLEQITRVYPVSHFGARSLDELFPGHAQKIEVAYLGTTDHGLGPVARVDSGNSGNECPFHLVSVANLNLGKRIDRLIEALVLLEAATAVPLRWTHFGGGDLESGLRSRAHKQLRRTRWEFCGHVTNSQLMAFYASEPGDVLVSVSESEGLPVSMMEAASFGIPIIATDVGGVGEIVIEGQSGLLLPATATTQAISDALRSLIELDPTGRQILRQGARGVWEQSFDAARNHAAFARKLREQLG